MSILSFIIVDYHIGHNITSGWWCCYSRWTNLGLVWSAFLHLFLPLLVLEENKTIPQTSFAESVKYTSLPLHKR